MKKKYFRPNCVVVHIAANDILAGSIPVSDEAHDNVSGDAKASSFDWLYDED